MKWKSVNSKLLQLVNRSGKVVTEFWLKFNFKPFIQSKQRRQIGTNRSAPILTQSLIKPIDEEL